MNFWHGHLWNFLAKVSNLSRLASMADDKDKLHSSTETAARRYEMLQQFEMNGEGRHKASRPQQDRDAISGTLRITYK
jgi:hypothetical protein